MSRSAESILAQAHRIAEKANLYFVPITEGTTTPRRAWVLYRKLPDSDRGSRICRCSTPGHLLGRVKKAAGIANKTPAPRAEEPAL